MAKLPVGLERPKLPQNIIQLPTEPGMPPTPPTMIAGWPSTKDIICALKLVENPAVVIIVRHFEWCESQEETYRDIDPAKAKDYWFGAMAIVPILRGLYREYVDTKATTPITQEALTALDFGKIHMNAAWNGGWFRYYKAIPDLHKGEVTVTFGDGYCRTYGRDCIVWFTCDYSDMLLLHVTTMEQLKQLWKLVTGKEL